MQVGAKKPHAAIICDQVDDGSVGKPYPLQIFGLSSRCIKPGVRKALEELLVDQMSLQAFRHDEKRWEKENPSEYSAPVEDVFEEFLIPFIFDPEEDSD